MNDADAAAFIRARFALSPLDFRPDIALYRPTSRSGLSPWLAAHDLADRPPYWAYLWGGGAALSLYLRDRADAVAGRHVLDFGAGSGLVAIAAAKAGAKGVTASETDPLGRIAIGLNAEANAVVIPVTNTPEFAGVETVLAGDVFYDRAVAHKVLPLLDQALAAGAQVLIGDPFRRFLPLHRLEERARYSVPDFGSGTALVPAAVFALRP